MPSHHPPATENAMTEFEVFSKYLFAFTSQLIIEIIFFWLVPDWSLSDPWSVAGW